MIKNLILYASETGNTEKIALKLKESFDDYGWDSELKRIEPDYDTKNPDFVILDYDFVCVGSPVHGKLPLPRITALLENYTPFGEIIPGPKCALVFATYAGGHIGPMEGEAALSMMANSLEHLHFRVTGRLGMPGMSIFGTTDTQYYGSLEGRPNERDLRRVAAFVDELFDHSEMRQYRSVPKPLK